MPEEEDEEERPTWLVERTDTIMAAAAPAAVMLSQEWNEPDKEKIHRTFVPPGFQAIRQIYSGVKHWSRKGGIPCCPPVHNAFNKRSFCVTKETTNRTCNKCIKTVERWLGVADAYKYAEGVLVE